MDEEGGVDLERIRDDLEQLKLDLNDLRAHLSDFGTQQVASVRAAGEARIMALRDEVDRVSGELQLQGRETLARIEQAVHERPLTSLMAAFGVGMLVSRVLERRR